MGNSYPITGTYNGETLPPGTEAAFAAFFGGFMIFFMIFAVLFYVYSAICYMKIARKTGTENAWMAWIPILNIILMLKVAGKPLWWIILYLIPLVNIIISIIVWMAISEKLGKPSWLGILMIVPVVNLIIVGYWAFSSGNIPAVQVNSAEPVIPPTQKTPASTLDSVAQTPPVPKKSPIPPPGPTSGPFV